MTESERIEYQAETARLRAANVARVQQDAESMAARDRVVRDALQALRDTDHAAAVLEGIAANPTTPAHVAETAVMMLGGGRLDRGTVLDMEHAAALEIDRDVYPLLRGLGEPHPAEPHSRRPTECRVCRRPIVGRFDDGKALSYTHRPKASL